MARLEKVSPGQRLSIPASTYNAFVDAAVAHRSSAPEGFRGTQADALGPIVLVRNDSGADVGRFAVLGIDGVVYENDPEDEDTFAPYANSVVLRGAEPLLPDHAGKFVITTVPIPMDGIGRARLLGVTPCRVLIDPDEAALEHHWADVHPGSTTVLRASPHTGSARIIWISEPDEADEADAVVQIGAGFAQVGWYKVANVGPDVLLCRPFDGTTEATSLVVVAKPWLLRRTPFDGLTYNGVSYAYTGNAVRDANDGEASEVQRITMDYVDGDLILAMRVPWTGAQQDGDPPVPAYLVDLNIDARAWAAEPSQLFVLPEEGP